MPHMSKGHSRTTCFAATGGDCTHRNGRELTRAGWLTPSHKDARSAQKRRSHMKASPTGRRKDNTSRNSTRSPLAGHCRSGPVAGTSPPGTTGRATNSCSPSSRSCFEEVDGRMGQHWWPAGTWRVGADCNSHTAILHHSATPLSIRSHPRDDD